MAVLDKTYGEAERALPFPDRSPARRRLIATLLRPDVLCVLLSTLFGIFIVGINPPLRGPDEAAHFLRIYGYARGEFISFAEVDGHKGLYLPASLYDDLQRFEDARQGVWHKGFTYHGVFADYRNEQARRPAIDARPPVFVAYGGTEGYTAAAYLPQIGAAVVAQWLGLDLVQSVYLLRLTGLIAMTAAAAYAIALTPHLKWVFLLIAMLPSALYGRAVIGADGATVAYSMIVTALALRAALRLDGAGPWQRALWMLLCVLTKPPQLAFILVEGMTARLRDLARHWRRVALVVLPGVVLSPLWVIAVSGEMAAWRIVGHTGLPPEQFDPVWKLRFMMEHPLHFPKASLQLLLTEGDALWRQLIGVLGWLDVSLETWIYVGLTLALLAVFWERIAADRPTRLRIAGYSALTIASYTFGVFLILFMTWTPPNEPVVWGVQGRYFVPVLPAAALALAALADVELAPRLRPMLVVGAALVSGVAVIEALWRVHWVGI